MLFEVNGKPSRGERFDWIKWAIWMPWIALITVIAPFMILGRALRNRFSWPALRLEAVPSECTGCHRCTRSCPMSLPVEQMVRINSLEHKECILCGNCIDECAHKAIHYTFSSGGKSLDATLRTATNRLRH